MDAMASMVWRVADLEQDHDHAVTSSQSWQGFHGASPSRPPNSTKDVPLAPRPSLADALSSGLQLAVHDQKYRPSPNRPPPFPSMLRYVDNHLLRSSHVHDRPPNPMAQCPVCKKQHNSAPRRSAFLPLSPCGHWIHYHCFVWHTTRASTNSANCPSCGVQLFAWEGISITTLATRTGIELEDFQLKRTHIDTATGTRCKTLNDEYKNDCTVIQNIIIHFIQVEYHRANKEMAANNAQLMRNAVAASMETNGLPDTTEYSLNLVQVLFNVACELNARGYPRSRWLKHHTSIGLLLWVTLLFIKLRRHVEECLSWTIGSQGWKQFEEYGRILAANMVTEVREDGMERA